jgi:hypothetical protein
MYYSGKRVTVIPVYKDEGYDGDRDYLQFDTISLMTLLNVNVIIAYYADAVRNERFENKITHQRFDLNYVRDKIYENLDMQSDALHWNREQLNQIGHIGELAMESYDRISRRLGVRMHSESGVLRKIEELNQGIDVFREKSRQRGRRAQRSESMTIQPKEFLEGEKGTITITNLYKGYYPLTVDEALIDGDSVYLIEGKHTRDNNVPSLADIKDALLKLIVYTNLKTVTVDGETYNAVPVLKLTNGDGTSYSQLDYDDKKVLNNLKREAETNRFRVNFNGTFL